MFRKQDMMPSFHSAADDEDKPDASLGITALILARGGSKGIPLKNIKLLHGVPLIGRTLKAALDWKRFKEIWVSTDEAQIAEVAKEYGALVHLRPPEVSGDTTPSITSVQEFLSDHNEVEYLALLQCTSPFLCPKFLENAYQMIKLHNYDSVFSVCRRHTFRWSEVKRGDSTKPLNFDPANRPRRQDWAGELVECGMFYFSRSELLQRGLFQGEKCGYVEIPNECSMEIDTPLDWTITEAILSANEV